MNATMHAAQTMDPSDERVDLRLKNEILIF